MTTSNPQDPNSFVTATTVAASQPGTPADEQVQHWCTPQGRVEAHYDDPWKTPVTFAELRITDQGGGVIDAGGRTKGLMTFGMEDGQPIASVRPELGSYDYRSDYPRSVTAEIVADPGAAASIAELEAQIIAEIEGFAAEMKTALQPWIDEWEDSSWWDLIGDFFESIGEGIEAWLEDEGDFWSAVANWLSNLPELAAKGWDQLTDAVKALWENRDKILGLLRDLAQGSVKAFEEGFAALSQVLKNIPGLEEIADLLRDLVEESAEWAAAMIELVTQTRVVNVLAGAMLATLMAIPPNFWAEMIGAGLGYLIPEIIIAILFAIIAFFTAGAGSAGLAARLTAFVAKVTAKLSKAGRAGQILLRAFSFLESITEKMIALIKALKRKIANIGKGPSDGRIPITRHIVRRYDDVPCFKLPKDKKGVPTVDPDEFDRQIEEQMAAINRMTVDEMADAHDKLDKARAEHKRLVKLGKRQKSRSFTDLLRDRKAQKDVRTDEKALIKYEQVLRERGWGEAKIDQRMEQIDATHTLDIIAGGNPSDVTIGDRTINRSIGSQWRHGGGAEGLGKEARRLRDAGLGNSRMNVKLKRCTP